MVFQQKLLEKAHFVVKMTGPVGQYELSDFCKAPCLYYVSI